MSLGREQKIPLAILAWRPERSKVGQALEDNSTCSCERALTAIPCRNKERHSRPPLCDTFKGILALLCFFWVFFTPSGHLCGAVGMWESLLNSFSLKSKKASVRQCHGMPAFASYSCVASFSVSQNSTFSFKRPWKQVLSSGKKAALLCVLPHFTHQTFTAELLFILTWHPSVFSACHFKISSNSCKTPRAA